jgi:hypothetical protein
MVPSGIVSATVEAYDAVNAKLELNDCDAHDALAWKAWLNGAYDALIDCDAKDAETVWIELIELEANDAEIECEANDAEVADKELMELDAHDAEIADKELMELDAHDAENTEPLTRNQLLSVVMSTR